jgi:hypothetical protein
MIKKISILCGLILYFSSFCLAQKKHIFGLELEGGVSRLMVPSISDTYNNYTSRFTPNYYMSLNYELNTNVKFNFVTSLKFGSLNDLIFVKNNNDPEMDYKILDKNRYIFICPGIKYNHNNFEAIFDINLGYFVNRIVISHLGDRNETIEKLSDQLHYRSSWYFLPRKFEPGINLAVGLKIIETKKIKISLFSKSSLFLSPNFMTSTLALRITNK